jgi:L-aspartate semialdehyde sulfurtransferase ferredoxin
MRRWFRLTYPLEQMNQPIIYQLIKRFDVITNVFQAKVEQESGWLILEMQGSDIVLTDATKWLVEQGLTVEEVEKPT